MTQLILFRGASGLGRGRADAAGLHHDRRHVHARAARPHAGGLLRACGACPPSSARCWAASWSISFPGDGSFMSTSSPASWPGAGMVGLARSARPGARPPAGRLRRRGPADCRRRRAAAGPVRAGTLRLSELLAWRPSSSPSCSGSSGAPPIRSCRCRCSDDRLFAVACRAWLPGGLGDVRQHVLRAAVRAGGAGHQRHPAGSALTPQMLGWVAASIIGGRLLLRLAIAPWLWSGW